MSRPMLSAKDSFVFTVLVVDDNKDIVEFLRLLLSHHGLTVLCAYSGQECLETVRSRPVDVIILDVMMPGIDGLDVCKELKRTSPSLPVILLTAKDDMATRSAAMALGVSEFVAKPVMDHQGLVARVLTLIRSREGEIKMDRAFGPIEPPRKAAPVDK